MSLKSLHPALGVYLLILSSPFGLYSIALPGSIGLTPINLVALALFPVALWHLYQEKQFPRLTAVGFLHLAFIVSSLISALMAADRFAAFRGTGAYFFDYFLCFFAVICFLKTREDIEKAALCYVIAGMLNALMGWVELIGYAAFEQMVAPPFYEGILSAKRYGFGEGAFHIKGFMRMFGFLGDSFGVWMVIPFGLCIYFVIRSKPHRTFFATLAFFLGLTILVSAARIGYVGMAFFGVTVALLLHPKRSVLQSFIRRASLMLALIAALLSFFYLARDHELFRTDAISMVDGREVRSPLHLITRINPFTSRSFAKSETYFSQHWELAKHYGLTHFGFGLGSENFDDFVSKNYPVKYGSHSDFILFLGNNGVWGLLIQILLFGMTVYVGIKTYVRQEQTRYDPLPLCLLGIYFALIVSGILRTFYLIPDSLTIIGLLVKLHELGQKKVPTPQKKTWPDFSSAEGISHHLKLLSDRFGLSLQSGPRPEKEKRKTETPLGPVREYRLMKGREEVAHQQFIPVELVHHGQKMLGLHSSNSWVAENYRGFGLLPALIGQGLVDLKQEGFKFFAAFPNQNSFPVLTGSCHIPHLGTCNYLVKPCRVHGIVQRSRLRMPSLLLKSLQGILSAAHWINRKRFSPQYTPVIEDTLPEGLDDLILRSKISEANYLVRNYEHLQWRYGHAEYKKIAVYHLQKLVGFMVCRSHVKDGLNIAAILEYSIDRGIPDCRAILKNLVFTFELQYSGCDIHSLLIAPQSQDLGFFKRLGYLNLQTRRFGRSFWFLFLKLDEKAFDAVDFSTWHLSFFDSIDSF